MWKRTELKEPDIEPAPAPKPNLGVVTWLLHSDEVLRPSVGADASINGRLSFSRPTRLDGTLHGEVHSSDLLVIGETGMVDGTVRAAKLLILGRVLGDVVEAGAVEIGPGGELLGQVEARAFAVQEGGHFDGRCRIQPPSRATVHILHPERHPPDPSTTGTEKPSKTSI
jgi:cytoskeletal protein CcmA (bactofilin family)